MPLEGNSAFAAAIQDHLELRRRNAALVHEMPLARYMSRDDAARPAHDGTEGSYEAAEDTGVLVPRKAAKFPEPR